MQKPKRCATCGLLKYSGRIVRLEKEKHGLWTCDDCIDKKSETVLA